MPLPHAAAFFYKKTRSFRSGSVGWPNVSRMRRWLIRGYFHGIDVFHQAVFLGCFSSSELYADYFENMTKEGAGRKTRRTNYFFSSFAIALRNWK
jgi:hypothetical protein